MTSLRIGAILSLMSLTLLALACGGSKAPATSRTDPGKIPTATKPANLPDPLILEGQPTSVSRGSGSTYVVQSGDSLYAIAAKLGTTVDELISLNNLKSNDLSVGQVLKVPASNASPPPEAPSSPTSTPTPNASTSTPSPTPRPSSSQTQYTVKSGDNANDIALSFGITVEELAAANHTTVEGLRSLQVGDVLIIPAPSATSTPAATQSPADQTTPTSGQ